MPTALQTFERHLSVSNSCYLYQMQRLILVFFLLILLQSCKNGVDFEETEPAFKTGDSLIWASKNYSSTHWRTERGNTKQAIFWIRFNPVIHKIENPKEHIGLGVYAFGAFEVYWDGVKIGANGQPGLTTKSEIPGTHNSIFLIPDSLSKPGKHVLALRATQQYKSDEQRAAGYKIDHYDQLLEMPLIMTSFMNLMAGAFLVVSLYYFFLFANSNRRDYTTLIFGVTCFLFFALLIAEYIKFYVAIPYTHFYLRLEIIGFLTILVSILVPLYFSIQFNFRKKLWLISGLVLVLAGIYIYNFRSYDLSAKLFSLSMWFAAVVVVVNAIVKKEKGSVLVFIGLLISMALNYFLVYDFGIFICFTIIVLCMLYLHAIKAKEIEKAHQSSMLLSSRLKLELLKKNIQPHFIKNTLTSLIDWVEESPKDGVVFIEALAAEFDVMNEIAEATLIPIAKEIELCKAHLAVMHFRKEVTYQWTEKNIDPLATIPPAIIHTLVENGITHSLALNDGSIGFILSFTHDQHFKTYTLLVNAKNRLKKQQAKQSTGFKYIIARLTESYGNNWDFESAAVPDGWCSIIKIKNE
ncbi:regulator [Pedobacter polaris]|uniref:Regulator n=1 Tax=Pedobacter polaris TaxID=2571273 RepID=A0A4U1CVF9_9SPHI|nr:sensor histidine kinase [Pedobacter polaris]TKC12823.1 regulator [Pedobacter polaris]